MVFCYLLQNRTFFGIIYVVKNMTKDILSVNGIKKYLKEADYKIEVYDCLDSTNALLKTRAQQGESEWTVIIADSQTSGRGRMTRKFYSPKNCGIYMSVLLKPCLPADKSVLITAAAAVAVSKAIENLSSKETKIKWVNDIFIENRKVCGILTEGGINPENMGFRWAVLGIGINVYTPDGGFDDEISNIAGAVFETRSVDGRNRLVAEILDLFRLYYESLESKSFFPEYKKRMLNIGKEINVIKGEEIKKAYCLDVDSDCRLKVCYPDNSQELLTSGEISIRTV